jgi:hypothetical protein
MLASSSDSSEEEVVDAYNESEQRTSLYTMLDERLEKPFKTEDIDALTKGGSAIEK